uniref:Uncharacterized protein n=1 Tax=Myotis lucifugus TaxID=59463 RepID=G1QBK5_MYOLU
TNPQHSEFPATPPASSPMASEESSPEVTAASPPSLPELPMGGTPVLAPPALPLYRGLLQQRHRGEETLQERPWEEEKAFLGHLRRRHVDPAAPYRVREAGVSSSGGRDQNRFRCECRYCHSHGPHVGGMPAERKGVPLPPSGESLLQGLVGLRRSLGPSRPGLPSEGPLRQQHGQDKLELEGRQDSKSMFQRLLKRFHLTEN